MDFFKELMGDVDYSGENIAVQNDHKFTKELESLLSKIVDVFTTYGLNNPSLRKNKESNALANDVENLIYKRFGIPIRFIGSDGFAYSLPYAGTFSSIVDVNRGDIAKWVARREAKLCKKGKCDIPTTNSDDVDDDKLFYGKNAKIVGYLRDSMILMNKLYANKSIRVDFDKAYIHGLSVLKKNKRVPLLAIAFRDMINGNVGIKQIAAIFMHELGHIFNAIAYANVFSRSALPALISITDSKVPAGERAVIAYKELTGKEATVDEALKMFPVELLKQINNSVGRDSAFYNSEIMADNFAVKFGYGVEAVTSLHNLGIPNDRSFNNNLFITHWVLLVILAIMAYPSIAAFQLIVYIVLYLPYVMMSGVQNVYDPHEAAYNRFRRVKLELIRELRTGQRSINADVIKDIINIMGIMEEYAYDKKLPQLIITYVMGQTTEVGYHELYQRLEQLSENDLHLLSMKMKLMTKDNK